MHIVIQGAGRGIGLALAQHARNNGATNLYLTARNPGDSEGYKLLPPSQTTRWFNLDFINPEMIEKVGAEIVKCSPKLDRVITCAGLLHTKTIYPEKRVLALDPAAMMELFQINAMGPTLFFKALWPHLKLNKSLIAASISARVGSISDNHLGGWYSYRASKAALNQYIRTMSIELSRYNPKASMVVIHPGTVNTSLSEPFQRNVCPDQIFSKEKAAKQIWSLLNELEPTDNGGFFAYDGAKITY